MKDINLELMNEPRENAGVKRLHEIFLSGGEPTSQEWEDGYADAVFEWERSSMEGLALLRALKVLDKANFAKVWNQYESILAEEIAKKVEELESIEVEVTH
ncbi:hypothetical protein MMG00_12250 [Ignatzschineria rhizosphaerae]|uniref:Uncharacterized protein n=1 Tax=Ignatzschineria rhizosphaerae TaxID=2923279 RepID=A0ABY3X3C1_9GAMM|nr:hypothetical protein [Ignatzschineria rhizosphaerae]UNM95957.1 hypothetical protein MMG00_12250 [Ignatzschineria rhizosphaerae]